MAFIRRGSALALATLALLLALQPLLLKYWGGAGVIPVIAFALLMLYIGLRKDGGGGTGGAGGETGGPSEPTEGVFTVDTSGDKR